jgi:hydrogenase/urease accessory protein HupE
MNGKTCVLHQCRCCVLFAAVVMLIWPTTAHAHLVSTGLGPFYDGITHLILTPDDLLGVLAIALLSGLGGTRHGRTALFILSTAWLVGGLLGLQLDRQISLPLVNTVSFLVVSILVAADRKMPLVILVGLASALGLLHGFLNGTGLAQAGGGILALFGIATAVFVMVALIAALVISLRAAWVRIAVRVIGSWITAIGLLMLGWAYRGVS